VERLIAEAAAEGRRCLLVITGKGLRSGPDGPVLRRRIVETLTQAPVATAVLGVVSAPSDLGGTGALLVLLRKRP
jgi:DNA-nicking Smr family endonuclease